MPLQGVIDHQYQDFQSMSRRPGLYIKYMPYRYHEINGQFLTGGSYLFDTWENAKNYESWSSAEFEAGGQKVNFWAQPMFVSSPHWAWKVVGAHNFAPVQEHAIGRFQRWKCESANAESDLREAYPKLKAAAEAQGAASFWLLYQPDEKMVAIQVAFKRTASADDVPSTLKSLTSIIQLSSLEASLPKSLDVQLLFDRTSLFLTCWLPKSREAGGSELSIPNYPVVPALSLESQ